LLVKLLGFDGFVNHRWRAAEAFALPNSEVLKVARDLDAKIEALLTAAS
jgi:hypothetical protein